MEEAAGSTPARCTNLTKANMKTSVQWWNDIKSNDLKIAAWLRKQWRGEVTASMRIKKLADQYTETDSKEFKILAEIARQEDMHAIWVQELLSARNVVVDDTAVVQAEERYWSITLPGIKDFATGTAVAAHAEGMRLERIRAIAEDESAPNDIRETFIMILKDEVWHEHAFRNLSTPEALAETAGDYKLAREALGLAA